MNTIYRIVWNAATGKWVVASELAKGRKKKSAAKIAVLALALAGLGAPVAFAAETDSQENTENADEHKSDTITPFYAIGGGDDGGRADNVAIGSGAATLSQHSVAIGDGATTNNVANVAIGWGANTTGSNAISMGYNATANGNYATSLGGGSSASAVRATAVGTDAVASGTYTTAVGNAASATGPASVALGYIAKAQGGSSVALGVGANAVANSSSALGASAAGNGFGSAAFGVNAVAGVANDTTKTYQLALGAQSRALADGSAAVGQGASIDANAQNGVAIGRNASVSATGVNSVALGRASVANRANTISVGAVGAERQIVNVTAGTADTDAVNVSQLRSGVSDATRYFKAEGQNDGSDDAVASGSRAVAVGAGAVANNPNTTAIGNTAKATGSSSTALGAYATAEGATSVALGMNATANTANSTALGYGAKAGVAGDPIKLNQVAVGALADAQADRSIAVGSGASVAADAQYGVAIGRTARVLDTGVNSVALGQDSVADRANTVSVGKVGAERQIANVAAGTADTDAVNVSQLKGTAESIADVIGGGSTVGSDGTISAPDYSVGGTIVHDVGTAIGNIDGRVTKNEGDIINLQAGMADAVMYDSAAHDSVTLGGSGASAPVALKNIADGALTDTSTDAVNGSQLHATNQNVAKNTTDITNLDGRVTNNEGDIVDIRNQLGSGSIGLVQQDATTRDITVAAGTDGGRVDFAGTDGARKLAGVAEGELSDTSAEAVNGSQLFATNERVSKNEGDIVNIGDRVTGAETNITNIDGRVTKNEGDITHLDGRVTTNEGDIVDIRNQLGSGSIGLVQQDATTRDITVAAGTDGGRVDFAGTDGARKLAGVAEGELSDTSAEAVNGSQLFATNERVSKNEGDIVNLDGRVTKNEGDIIDLGDRINNGSVGLVQQAGASAAVTVAAATGGAIVDFTGTDGTRQLKGVSEGSDGTDAVNVTQLRNELAKASAGDTRYFKADGANDGSDDAINSGSRSVAIGAGSQATADNAVALGAGSVADRANAVSVGSAGNERQIVNVADGTEDTDAVNVRQLKSAGLVGDDGSLMDAVVYDAGSNRGSITLGGVAGTTITNVMAGLVAPGSMDAINGSQLWGVQDQITKLGDRVTTIENGGGAGSGPVNPIGPVEGNPHFASSGDAGKPATATGSSSVAAGEGAMAGGNNSTAIGAGSSATGNNSVAIGAGSVADGDNMVSVGSVGNERRIANVAAGTQRTDAANVGQLQDAMSNLQDWTQGQVNGLSKKVDNVQRQANRGIAASAALVNNMPYLPGKVTLNAGVAAYRGQSALGVGMSRWNDSGRFNVNAGISAAQGDAPIFRVGVGMVLGD